eukprot:TRINITY_DN6046_c0_g1_i2.p1 TRINITY_DN6046_c0_g1~~TRINITY_DN6046_c0_g1_i2.p1  ORF type:complete len:279 (-),score=61.78 TRINITY_DN6046_c0_g1_i2:89-925(-)
MEKESGVDDAVVALTKSLQKVREQAAKERETGRRRLLPVLTGFYRSSTQLEGEVAKIAAPALDPAEFAYGAVRTSVLDVGRLAPRRKPLATRRSKRCRKCSIVVAKPEVQPDSAGMHINRNAFSNLAHISILFRPAEFVIGQWATCLLMIQSPITQLPLQFGLEALETSGKPEDAATTAVAGSFVTAGARVTARCTIQPLDEDDEPQRHPAISQLLAVNEDTPDILWESVGRVIVRVHVQPNSSAGVVAAFRVSSQHGGEASIVSLSSACIVDFGELH